MSLNEFHTEEALTLKAFTDNVSVILGTVIDSFQTIVMFVLVGSFKVTG